MTSTIFTKAGQLNVEGLALARAGGVLGVTASLSLSAGDRCIVSGASGVGKSTLLRSIVGLETPVSGTVTLDGRRPEDWTWPAFRRRVVYVHQKAALFDGTTADNLGRPFSYATQQGPFVPAEARQLLDRLGLQDTWEREAKELSGGEQQRLVLARALLTRPAFILLDEPSAGLDKATASIVAEVLTDATGQGLGLAVVTHDDAFADALAPSKRVELASR